MTTAAPVFAGVGSRAAAAVVLMAPEKARSALIQGAFPAIATVLLALSLL